MTFWFGPNLSPCGIKAHITFATNLIQMDLDRHGDEKLRVAQVLRPSPQIDLLGVNNGSLSLVRRTGDKTRASLGGITTQGENVHLDVAVVDRLQKTTVPVLELGRDALTDINDEGSTMYPVSRKIAVH